MKKMIIIAMMALSLGSLAQVQTQIKKDTIEYPTSGRFVTIRMEKNHKFLDKKFLENYCFSVNEISQVFKISKGIVDRNKYYKLTTGMEVQIHHPEEWIKCVIVSYQLIDSTINTVERLEEAIASSVLTKWDLSMPRTRNYYWSANNYMDYLPLYSGAVKDMPVVTYKGMPTFKPRSCINPQQIEITPRWKILGANTISKHDTIFVDRFIIKHDTVKKVASINGGRLTSTPSTNNNNNAVANNQKVQDNGHNLSSIEGSGAQVVSRNQKPVYAVCGYHRVSWSNGNNNFNSGSGAKLKY